MSQGSDPGIPAEPTEKDLVVVGASAGGIEALSQFVAGLPGDFAAPIVVAQHLEPTRANLALVVARRLVERMGGSVEAGRPASGGQLIVRLRALQNGEADRPL